MDGTLHAAFAPAADIFFLLFVAFIGLFVVTLVVLFVSMWRQASTIKIMKGGNHGRAKGETSHEDQAGGTGNADQSADQGNSSDSERS